MLNFFETADII